MSQPITPPAQQAADKPSKDDVHEQRHDGQQAEGVKQPSRDEARADWEGMAQEQAKPKAP